ncbi:MAG: Sortilin, neurotensin receptor 3 [Fibrobacterota bacterium]
MRTNSIRLAALACAGLCLGKAVDAQETRQNLGIYGGTVLSTAWEHRSGRLFASVAGPLSLFASDDTGRTWKPAYPTDSLKWMEGQTMRGWAGRGMNVWAKEGIVLSRSVEEGGVLWAATASADGRNFRTAWDEKLVQGWRDSTRRQSGGDPFLGGFNTAHIHKGKVFLGLGGALMVSKDTGRSWKAMPFPDSSGLIERDARKKHGIQHVLVAKDDFSKLFVVASAPTNDMGSKVGGAGSLYGTSDSGRSWKEVVIPDTIGGKDTTHLQHISMLWRSERSSDTILLLNAPQQSPVPSPDPALFLSADGGLTWTKIVKQSLSNPPNPNSMQLAGLQVFQDSLFKGPSGIRLVSGASYSDDLGTSWTRLDKAANGEIGQITGITGHIEGTDIWFASSDLGPKTSFDGINSANYRLGTEGMTSLSISRVGQLPNQLHRVYLATNTGLAFTTAYTDTTVKMADKWKAPHGQFPIVFDLSGAVSDVAIDPKDSLHLVASTGNGLWFTKNGGLKKNDWTAVNFRDIPGWQDWCFVRDLEFYNSDTIFAATKADQSDNGGLLMSGDGGKSWKTVAAIGNRPVNSVTVAENASGAKVIYVGTGKATVPGWLFRSRNGGATWDTIKGMDATNNPGRKQLPVRDVEARPGSLDTIFIAGGDNTDWAVGWSFNGGDSIKVPRQKGGGAEISRIAVNKHHPDSVYFAMRNSILLLDLTVDTAAAAKGFEWPMCQMNWFTGYPGEILYDIHYDELMMASSVGAFGITSKAAAPLGVSRSIAKVRPGIRVFQTASQIKVAVDNAANARVRIELYDLKGKRIKTALSEVRPAGEVAAEFDASALRSGVYVVRATTATASKAVTITLQH